MDGGYPLVKDLVLVGGGHAHVLVLRAWAMAPLPGVRLTLINPHPVAPYTGMLPGFVAGHYSRAEMMIDLVRLARHAGARLILDRAVGVDRLAQKVTLAGRGAVAYDLLSLDIGIESDLPDVPGFVEHGTAAKPLGGFAAAWDGFVARRLPEPQVVIVGAGVGGVELALAVRHRLQQVGVRPQVTILSRSERMLPGLGPGARRVLLAELTAAGVRMIAGATATQIGADAVTLTTGSRIPADFTIAVAGGRAQGWLSGTGLSLQDGFVAVDARLRSSDPLIFSAGDCAHMTASPRPKAGVFAVRAAPVLLHNLRAVLTGRPLRLARMQGDYLKLISLGGPRALGEKWGLHAQGSALWRLKDRIDRAFMDRFLDYPAMSLPALPSPRVEGLAEAMGTRPLCGGCGAKIGALALQRGLAVLPAPVRPEVARGAGDDAAILSSVGAEDQVITTDHLRQMLPDPFLLAELAATHALGDIWAMGAKPEVALSQITLPPASDALQGRMLAEILTAASAVFRAAGADIVGGHSSVGAELTIGFTVTGRVARPVRKGGAQPGDVLVLTKPLGSGTILAAEMAKARLTAPGQPMMGEAWAACIASMIRSLGPAAGVLAPEARAMTDVTGFGLAGHLLEMLEASGFGAQVALPSVPFLPGSVALARQGEASSVASANRAAALGRIIAPQGPEVDLLYDPQTCGGLLAALPQVALPGVVAAMAAMDEPLYVIGRVTEGPALIRVTG